MTPSRRLSWYVLLAVADGFAAAYLAKLAFVWPGLGGLGLAKVRVSEQPFTEIGIVAFIVAAAFAPLLVYVLERFRSRPIGRFLALSGLAGVAYGFVTSWATAVVLVPLVVLHFASPTDNLLKLVVAILFYMYLVLWGGIAMSLLYAPVIVLGGSFVGVVNGLVVRAVPASEGMRAPR